MVIAFLTTETDSMSTATMRRPRELVHLFPRTVISNVPTGPGFSIADFLIELRNRLAPGERLASPGPQTELQAVAASNRIREYESNDSSRSDRDTAALQSASAPSERLFEICRLDLIREDIRSRLQRSMRLCSLDSSKDLFTEDLVRLYMEGMTALDAHRQEFAQFIAAILEDQCRCEPIPDSEISQRVGDQANARGFRWHDERLRDSVKLLKENIQAQVLPKLQKIASRRLTFDPEFHLGPSIVTAQLCAGDKEQLFLLLRTELHQRIERLVTWITGILETGAQNGVFGFVVWIDLRHCFFTHFTQWVEVEDFRFDVGPLSVTLGGTKGSCGFEASEVHLIDAKHFIGLPGWMRLPSRVVKIVNALPVLLRPYVGVVDGTVVRERKIRSALRNIETNEQVEIDLPRPKPDPAIVIGNVVLAGWSDAEAAHSVWRSMNHFRTLFERKHRILGSSVWV
jgi:hypothetical protein